MTYRENLSFLVCLVLTLSVGFFLTIGNIIFGPLNHDEGWYIYSALQVGDGRFPFVDFAFTQPPLLPLVYSLGGPVFENWGLLGARSLTAIIAWVAAFVWASLAAKISSGPGRRWAFLMVLMLVLLNSYHSYFTVIPKTYALTLLVFGFFAHALERSLHGEHWKWALFAGVLAGITFCSRISCLPLLLVPPVVFFLRDRNLKSSQGWSFAIGAGASILILLGPFFLAEPGNTWFGLVAYHGLRDPGTLSHWMLFKVGFLARVMQGYALICFLGLVSLMLLMVKKRDLSALPSEQLFLRSLGFMVLLITLIQFSAPFPYDDYQVIVMPALAVWLVVLLLQRGLSGELMRPFIPIASGALWIFSVILIVGSPIHQDWMISGRDRIWWEIKNQPDLIELQKTADLLPDESRGELLLTQDLYLAVEAGMRVPEGLEMGPFAFYPSWSSEEAFSHHVMNTERFIETIETARAPWAAISGYAFAIESPDVGKVDADTQARLRAALVAHYEPVHRVPDFGQGATELIIYRLKPEASE